jgi:hypothetical protein
VTRRLSIQDAFNLLLRHFKPWTARKRLETALHENDVRLWGNDALLTPTDILDEDLYVHAKLEPDGRWRCTIETKRPFAVRVKIISQQDDGTYTVEVPRLLVAWEVDAEDVEGLLPRPAHQRGVRSVLNWTGIVDAELQKLKREESNLLENLKNREHFERLETHLSSHVKQETGQLPKYPRKLRQRIREKLGVPIKK